MNNFRGGRGGRGGGRGFHSRPKAAAASHRAGGGPHLAHNSCCSEPAIRLELEPDAEKFLSELKNLWNLYKRSPPVVSKLHFYFNSCANPFEETIKLMYNCQEFKIAKSKSLPFFIVEEFKVWQNRDKLRHLLTPKLKIDVFKVISMQKALNLTKLVVEVYEMVESGEVFLTLIRCMIDKKNYREACQSAVLFKLQDKFNLEDFILPLILQDKMFGTDEFLSSSPRHQIELVTLLDSTLGKSSVRDALASFVFKLNVPDIKWEKLHAKPIKKLIARYVKMFKLSNDLTPNLNKRRNEGALQFLLHKRYIDNSFGDESWKEMVQEAIGNDEDLQKELIVQVNMYGDVAEALKWAHFYQIDKQHWPYNVRMLEENPDGERLYQRNIVPPTDEDSWSNDVVASIPTLYHEFPLDFSAIQLIDSVPAFERFLDQGLRNVDIVGIDCEWKPNFTNQKSELALMQLATRSNVYILDIIKIGPHVPHLWQELGTFLFNNGDILKLGFGFTSDNSMIKHTLPELNFSPKQLGFLDLLSLWKILEKHQEVVLPFEVQSSGPSLGTLVQHCLGRPLDKSDQFSNWEKRPLRDSQLTYAALDAYCLIQVYDVIKQCCQRAQFPFDETCYNLMTNEKPKKNKKKPVKVATAAAAAAAAVAVGDDESKLLPQPASPHVSHVPAANMKVVCDTMLQGLGKNLRRCGVDTAILENNMEHMECVKLALDERRYILTKGTVYNHLQGYVPQGHCLRIRSHDVDEQLKEFLDYYRVSVTKDDVFSVCQACNGRCFVKVSQSTMLALTKAAAAAATNTPPTFTVDEATGFSSEDDECFEPGPPLKKWDLYCDEKIDVGLCRTKKGAPIQISAIPEGVLDKMDFFYVCEECGKVYWDGSHLERVLSGRLQGIVQ